MEFIKEELKVTVKTADKELEFQLLDKVFYVDTNYYMIGTPLNYLSLYPSGEDSVIVFRINKDKSNITGFEDDLDIINQVMEQANNF